MPAAPPRHNRSFAEPISGFQAEKVLEYIALFLKLSDRRIEKLKLVKLLYLTEREFLRKTGELSLWDEYYSLPHGPICSSSLHIIDGYLDEDAANRIFAVQNGKDLTLKDYESSDQGYDYLSDSEISVARDVWEEHKHRTSSQLRNFTHQYCPEYKLINRGRIRIRVEDLMQAVGLDDIEERAAEVDAYREALAQAGTRWSQETP